MKKILVPTDFSQAARCAFFYARKLASASGGGQLKVVHIFMPAVEAEYPNMVPPVTEYLKVREDMLREFVDECCQEDDPAGLQSVTIERELLIGFPAEEIARISEDYDMIVMGTTGESDLLNKMFGSVSSAVAKRAECPVILVPKDMDFRGFSHILYASNYESVDEKMLAKLLAFNQQFGACIHFVHVREEEKGDFEKNKEEIFEELFENGEPSFSFQMAEVEGHSVAEGLNQYAKENRIDLVVMVNRKRSFWETFFHKSQTKEMALHAHLPLMILHLK